MGVRKQGRQAGQGLDRPHLEGQKGPGPKPGGEC